MKKILITGGSGFFGRSLLAQINNHLEAKEIADCEFYCSFNTKPENSHSKITWIKCDLLNADEVHNTISNIKPDVLVHLAWDVKPKEFWKSKANVEWLYSSVKLFQSFCDNGGKAFIGAGTIAEYEWQGGILDERCTLLRPNSLYGQCKKSLHELLISTRDAYYRETKIIWPRLGYFFGSNEPEAKLISKLIHNIENGLPLNLASPDLKKPYAHVKYFGQVIFNLLIKIFNNSLNNDLTFNLSSEHSHALKDIVNYIQNQLDQNSAELKYHAYLDEISLDIKTPILHSEGLAIPDTFFQDLQAMIMKNNVLV